MGRINYEFAGTAETIISKTADESVASSTTLQADNHLIIPVEANTTYRFRLGLYIVGANATHDGKLGFAVPASATMRWAAPDTHFIPPIGSSPIAPHTESTTLTFGTRAGDQLMEFYGFIFVAGTAGDVTLQWAQNTSDAGNLTFKAGCHIAYRKLL